LPLTIASHDDRLLALLGVFDRQTCWGLPKKTPTMRYRIRVRVVRYLDMLIRAFCVDNAHRLALKASERVPSSQWEVYKGVSCPDDIPKSDVKVEIIRGRPQAQELSNESEASDDKEYHIRVEDRRWCDFTVEAPTKKAAIRKAANMDVAAIVPPSAWDGFTSTGSEVDDLEPGF
jgi:hypothetical protein